jgi:hypothetical protein
VQPSAEIVNGPEGKIVRVSAPVAFPPVFVSVNSFVALVPA